MYREFYCWWVVIQSARIGAVRELSVLKHVVTSRASVSGPLPVSKSSAISLGFRGSSYLTSTGSKQNSQSHTCDQGDPNVPLAQGQYNFS